MKLMGFNAIRIPFSFKDLYDKKPLNFRVSNCPAPSLEDMLNGITDPDWTNPCALPLLPSPCLAPNRQVSARLSSTTNESHEINLAHSLNESEMRNRNLACTLAAYLFTYRPVR